MTGRQTVSSQQAIHVVIILSVGRNSVSGFGRYHTETGVPVSIFTLLVTDCEMTRQISRVYKKQKAVQETGYIQDAVMNAMVSNNCPCYFSVIQYNQGIIARIMHRRPAITDKYGKRTGSDAKA